VKGRLRNIMFARKVQDNAPASQTLRTRTEQTDKQKDRRQRSQFNRRRSAHTEAPAGFAANQLELIRFSVNIQKGGRSRPPFYCLGKR